MRGVALHRHLSRRSLVKHAGGATKHQTEQEAATERLFLTQGAERSVFRDLKLYFRSKLLHWSQGQRADYKRLISRWMLVYPIPNFRTVIRPILLFVCYFLIFKPHPPVVAVSYNLVISGPDLQF